METTPTFRIIKNESKNIGLELSDESIHLFETYLRELTRWNKRINLTGHKDEKSIIANLFIDSLAFHKALSEEFPSSILDIGSGAGFPAVPLKIFEPRLAITMVEPNLKKVSFLHHIIGTLELDNVKVEVKRIEDIHDIPTLKNAFDCILLKALRFDVCLPYVRGLLRCNGRVILSLSKTQQKTQDISGFNVQKEISYKLPFGFGGRALLELVPLND